MCLVVSGCTARQSRAQYEERLEQALEARAQATRQLDSDALTTQAQYDAAAAKVAAALEELDADPPPSDAEPAHDRMIDGLEGLSALLGRLGRCTALGEASDQDERACRASIGQGVYDEIRNDFGEANTIYREEGFSLPGLGSAEDAPGGGGDSLGTDPEGGDEL